MQDLPVIRYHISESHYAAVASWANVRRCASTLLCSGWIAGCGIVVHWLDPSDVAGLPFIAVGLAGVAIVSLHIAITPYRARRIYREQFSAQEERQLTASEDQIEFVQPSGSFRAAWTTIHRWNESRQMLLIYLNRISFIPVPKDQIGLEVSAYLRDRLTGTGLARGRRRRKP